MKHIETNKWVYNSGGDTFDDNDREYTSREEAIEACLKDYGGGCVGRCVELEFDESDFFYDEIGIYLEEVLYDEVGDASNCWELSDEHDRALTKVVGKVVSDYLKEHNLHKPTCYRVVDVVEV